jgi:hypothetical protein
MEASLSLLEELQIWLHITMQWTLIRGSCNGGSSPTFLICLAHTALDSITTTVPMFLCPVVPVEPAAAYNPSLRRSNPWPVKLRLVGIHAYFFVTRLAHRLPLLGSLSHPRNSPC